MTQKRATKTSIYPKSIQRMIQTAHAKRARASLSKRLDSKAIATQINESKTAQKLGVEYTYRQIAVTLGNLTRQHGAW
jgi:hypothetical protein